MRCAVLVAIVVGLCATSAIGCGNGDTPSTSKTVVVVSSSATLTSTTTTTASPTTTTTAASGPTAEDEAAAENIFAQGAEIYLYNPQPATVALSALRSTTYTVQYIVAEGAGARDSTMLFSFRVAADGTEEEGGGDGAEMVDWTARTGSAVFSTVSYDLTREAQKGMIPDFAWVDNPVSLVFVLYGVEDDSQSMVQLSNPMTIAVTP
jgi:hypothetical protein